MKAGSAKLSYRSNSAQAERSNVYETNRSDTLNTAWSRAGGWGVGRGRRGSVQGFGGGLTWEASIVKLSELPPPPPPPPSGHHLCLQLPSQWVLLAAQ